MNKQFAIAALVSSTNAAVAKCDDAYTALADAGVATAEADVAAAKKATETALAVQTKAIDQVKAEKLLWEPINTLIAGFKTKYDKAVLDHNAAKKAWTDASDGTAKETLDVGDTKALGLWDNGNIKMSFTAAKTDLTDLEKAKITAANAEATAKTDAEKLQITLNTQNAELTRRKTQQGLYDKDVETAKSDNTAWVAADNLAKQWAEAIKLTWTELQTSDLVTKVKADAKYNLLKATDIDAIELWRRMENDKNTQSTKTASSLKEVTDAWTAIEGKVAEEKDRHITTYAYSDNDACGADGSLCKDGDKVHADRGTSKAKHSALDGLYTTYDGKVTPYITEFEKQLAAQAKVDNAKLAVDALKKVADDDATAKKTTASQEVDARTKLKDATDKAVTNAQNDVNETTALLAAKNLERARLAKNTVVATHIWELAKDKFDKLTSVKDLLNRKQLDTQAQMDLAKASYDRTVAHMKVYQDAYDGAVAIQKNADADVTACQAKDKTAAAALDAAKTKQAKAVANCKGVQYGKAQAVFKAWDEKRIADKDKSAKAAEAYAKVVLAATPTDGSAGTRCEYPKKAEDGTQAPRPLCKENKEAPLCCGSANKYLRDGTRLTVETCQTAKGTHNYKYYPKFKAGSTVAPTPEMWRFYCIQGANKLAATVVALGAAYYMV